MSHGAEEALAHRRVAATRRTRSCLTSGDPGRAEHDPRRAVGDGSAREVRDLA